MFETGTHSTGTPDGTFLHWEELGAGRPLVLLHGISDSHRSWRSVAQALASTHRVFMLDLAGHGLSGRPDASYELDWHAGVVGRWIDHLGLDEIDLVGHSFGGGVAQFLLLSHGERVRRLGLVAPGGLGHEVSLGLRLLTLPGAERVVQPFLGIGTSVALRTAGAPRLSPEDRRWVVWANSAPGTARALVRTVRGVIDLRGQYRHFLERAHEVSQLPPVAVYWGERDPVLPVAQAYRAVAQIKGARLTTFPGCGHFPHLEQPDAFIGALASFLDDSEACRARIVVGAAPPKRPGWLGRSLAAAARGLRHLWRRARSRRQTPPKALLANPDAGTQGAGSNHSDAA
jgi:pimeloyl-ACP methyl ester carboxylesterase